MFRRPLCQFVSCYHEIIVIIVISAEHRGEGDTVDTHERGSSLPRDEAGNSALFAHPVIQNCRSYRNYLPNAQT